ncbi:MULTISPECIES: AAA family ATPase [Methylomonas]|uniref:AAA family ATPase n=1 Tax=Methylomonas TaxID=416 RepID=UPI0012323777|nr:AAA family ATPase [Methylomonas rhizoryzae]
MPTKADPTISALRQLLEQAEHVILGKQRQIRLAVCCLLAKGHLLIEDLPGVGKTTLAHTLAGLFGLEYQRIQFTSDILPADIIGSSVFDARQHSFSFHPGPIFNQLILADEINRATPKAQSALLEAMEERQVTAEGVTYPLPQPFFVVATQNPSHQIGTFPLPESQLDRFLMRIALGYPDSQAERQLLQGQPRHRLIADLPVALAPDRLREQQLAAEQVYVSPALLDYLQAILEFTRQSEHYPCGLSPRAGLALLAAAKAWAYLHGRNSVLPDDLQAILPAVAAHRLLPDVADPEAVIAPIFRHIPVH